MFSLAKHHITLVSLIGILSINTNTYADWEYVNYTKIAITKENWIHSFSDLGMASITFTCYFRSNIDEVWMDSFDFRLSKNEISPGDTALAYYGNLTKFEIVYETYNPNWPAIGIGLTRYRWEEDDDDDDQNHATPTPTPQPTQKSYILSTTYSPIRGIFGELLLGLGMGYSGDPCWSSDGNYFVSAGYYAAHLWSFSSSNCIAAFFRHQSSIDDVTLSSSNSYILTGSEDDTAKIWNRKTGKVISLIGHEDIIVSVDISPDEKFALTGSWDGTAKLWRVNDGSLVRTYSRHKKSINAVAFSPDGNFAMTGSSDNTVRVWEVPSGNTVITFRGHEGDVSAVAFSPDSKFALSGSSDNAKVWEISTGKIFYNLPHQKNVISVDISSKGKYAITGIFDRILRLWDLSNGKEIISLKGREASFSPDEKYVLTDYNHITLWEIPSGNIIRSYPPIGHKRTVSSAIFSPNGQYVLTGSDSESNALLWNVQSGQEIYSFKGIKGNIGATGFSSDGEHVFTADGKENLIISRWDVNSGVKTQMFQPITGYEKNYSQLTSLAYSHDGQYILTGNSNRSANLWDVKNGNKICTFNGHGWKINAVAISPEGKYALTGSNDNSMKLWDIQNRNEIFTWDDEDNLRGDVVSVAFSPDGKHALGVSEDAKVKIFEIESGDMVRTFKLANLDVSWVDNITFSPDKRYVLLAYVSGSFQHVVKLLDIQNNTEMYSLIPENDSRITSAAFSFDGKYIATGDKDGTIQLWDRKSGTKILIFEDHKSYNKSNIHTLAFSPNNKYVLSGSEDHTARLWDIKNGTEMRNFNKLTGEIIAVTFSPDGKYAVTASEDSIIRLWPLNSSQLPSMQSTLDEKILPLETETHLKGLSNEIILGLGSINTAHFSAEGKYLLTGGSLGTFLWEVETSQLHTAFWGHQSDINDVDISQDNNFILTGSEDTTAKVWNRSSGQIRTLTGHKKPVICVDLSADGRYAITGSEDQTAKVWNIESGDAFLTLEHENQIKSVALSPTHNYVLIGTSDGEAILWDLKTGEKIATYPHPSNVQTVAFSPNEAFVLTGDGLGIARIWNSGIKGVDIDTWQFY